MLALARRGRQIPRNYSYRQLGAAMQVLGIEFGSSGRVASSLNSSAIFPAPACFLKCLSCSLCLSLYVSVCLCMFCLCVCVCVGVCVPVEDRGIRSLGVRVMDSCETPHLGVRNWTQVSARAASAFKNYLISLAPKFMFFEFALIFLNKNIIIRLFLFHFLHMTHINTHT